MYKELVYSQNINNICLKQAGEITSKAGIVALWDHKMTWRVEGSEITVAPPTSKKSWRYHLKEIWKLLLIFFFYDLTMRMVVGKSCKDQNLWQWKKSHHTLPSQTCELWIKSILSYSSYKTDTEIKSELTDKTCALGYSYWVIYTYKQ